MKTFLSATAIIAVSAVSTFSMSETNDHDTVQNEEVAIIFWPRRIADEKWYSPEWLDKADRKGRTG